LYRQVLTVPSRLDGTIAARLRYRLDGTVASANPKTELQPKPMWKRYDNQTKMALF